MSSYPVLLEYHMCSGWQGQTSCKHRNDAKPTMPKTNAKEKCCKYQKHTQISLAHLFRGSACFCFAVISVMTVFLCCSVGPFGIRSCQPPRTLDRPVAKLQRTAKFLPKLVGNKTHRGRKKNPSVLFFALLSSAGSCSHSAKNVCLLPLGLLECKGLHL